VSRSIRRRRFVHLVLSAVSICLATRPELYAGSALPEEPRVSIPIRAKRPDANTTPPANIRLDVNVVLIPVSVTDALDHPVKDLSVDSFRLLEDNVEQKIACFFQEDAPISMGLIFDASGSMRKSIDRSMAAVEQLLKTTVPGDEFFLIRFSDKPTVETGFTSDPGQILERLSFVNPKGWTALHDAMYLGIHRMKPAKNKRRVLFILSDGGDNNSRYSESEIKNLVMESDVRVYAIGLFERPKFLERMAALTGGEVFWARRLKDLPDATEKLSRALRNQYVLGYSPSKRQNDGKYRKIKVEFAHPFTLGPLRLLWRHGYYAPYAATP
jgi:Ca-activated chloride channel family protein